MNKEREKLLSYLTDLKTYAEAILESIESLDDFIIDGRIDDEGCKTIRNIFQSKTSKTNMSDVNLILIQISRILSGKTVIRLGL